MKKIALVGPYHPKTRETLYQMCPAGFDLYDVPTREDYSKLSEADYVIIRTIRLEGGDLANATRLRFIQKWGAGYDSLDIPGISARDIPVATCVGINAQPVAELAVLHILAVYRHLLVANRRLKENVWAKDEFSSSSYLISGKTVGLVGLGNIGRKVAKIIQGFGATVQYYDMFRITEAQEQALGITYCPLDTLLATSDIVSLHVPLTEQTVNLIDKARLAMMKPTAILVNTARGGIVNEADLLEALQEKRILGAGLDAFAAEPPGADCPFYSLENAVITPHIGGNTADNDVNMIARCFENIKKFSDGLPLGRRDVVNAQLLYTKIELED